MRCIDKHLQIAEQGPCLDRAVWLHGWDLIKDPINDLDWDEV